MCQGQWKAFNPEFHISAEQAARLKKMEEEEKRKKAAFRKKVKMWYFVPSWSDLWIMCISHFLNAAFLLFLLRVCVWTDGEGGVGFHPGQLTAETEVQSHGETGTKYPVSTSCTGELWSCPRFSREAPRVCSLEWLSVVSMLPCPPPTPPPPSPPPSHDVAEVAGLTSFSFGEDEESRYVMLFKKVGSFWIFVGQ